MKRCAKNHRLALSRWCETIVVAAIRTMRFTALIALAWVPLVARAAPDTILIDSFEETAAYDVAFAANTTIGNSIALLGSINVAPGSYVAFMRMQVMTGSVAPGNDFRLDCTLSPGFDSAVYRVGMQTNVERYLTLQGAATLANAGAIQFSCRDGNGHSDTLLSGKLTVLSASAVN